jgi:urease accessory protein
MNHSRFRHRRLFGPVFLAVFALAPRAEAHTSIQGMGEFGSGLLHPATTPSHMLLLLALSLWAGQHWFKGLKLPFLTFVAASALGLILSTPRWISEVYPPLLIGIACVIAALVAMHKPLPSIVAAVIYGIAGVAIGLDSGVENGSTIAIVKTLAGTWISLMLILFDLAFYISRGSQKKFIQIGIRVLGSWIIAISLLMLAFALRK